MNRSLSQNIIFFPNTCQYFSKSDFQSSSQILYPVKKFCVLRSLTLYLVKSRTPRIPPQTNADLINKGVELNHMEGNMAKDSYSDVFSIF